MLSRTCGLASSHLSGVVDASAPPPRFLQAPSLRDGSGVVPRAGGLCPLARPEGVGYHLPRHRCTWATASDDICADRGRAAAVVCPPRLGGGHPPFVRSRGGYSPPLGGDLR